MGQNFALSLCKQVKLLPFLFVKAIPHSVRLGIIQYVSEQIIGF